MLWAFGPTGAILPNGPPLPNVSVQPHCIYETVRIDELTAPGDMPGFPRVETPIVAFSLEASQLLRNGLSDELMLKRALFFARQWHYWRMKRGIGGNLFRRAFYFAS